MLLRLLLSWCLFHSSLAVIIKTGNGLIKGAELKTRTGKLTHAFKRVPFAEPPVGPLRFESVRPPSKWSGILDATEYGPACMSNSSFTSSPQKWVAEDCLHENIFVSDKCLKSSCPVVVYIHGGGFEMDSAVMFKDDYVINNFGEQDLVMVITAFRMGFTSQLNFNNDHVQPRNLGVHDIVASLEWIQKEISYFGGDPKQVSLFGHSMGGTVVLSMAFSKTIDPNRRLFHRAVAMSPQMIFTSDMRARSLTWTFANRAGCSKSTEDMLEWFSERVVRETVDCLRAKDAYELLAIQRKMEEEGLKMKGIVLTEPLFDSNYDEFYKNPPKIPLLTGSTSRELDFSSEDGYSTILPDLMLLDNPYKLGRIIEKRRNDETLPFNHTSQTLGFFIATYQYAHEMRRQGVDTYLYSYENPVHPKHTDDLSYIMGVHVFEPDENEKELAKIYPQLFMNFMKTGKPNDEWEPLREHDDNYYYIDVNVTSGLKPKNALHYRREVISFFTNDLSHIDRKLTAERSSAVKAAPRDVGMLPSSLQVDTTGFAISIFAWFGMFILIGFFIGKTYASRNIQPIYVMGTPDEKTPLYDKAF